MLAERRQHRALGEIHIWGQGKEEESEWGVIRKVRAVQVIFIEHLPCPENFICILHLILTASPGRRVTNITDEQTENERCLRVFP